MFSSRTRWNRAENRLAALIAARRASGAPLVDLTLSNPSQAGLVAPADLIALLGDPGNVAYQPEARGQASARAAVAADFARRGHAVAPDCIVLTSSSSEAYAYLFKLLCDPGDAVLVPRPSYPLFEFLAGLEGLATLTYPLAYDGAWHLDFAALAAAVTPGTRAVVVVNPNNPTGSYLSRAEAERLLGWCAERELAIVSDEVFADYALDAGPDRAATLAGSETALVFALGGLSKSCGLPQLKLGWIAASGPRGARDEALARLEIVADSYLSVSTPVQRALPRILARLRELQAPIAARLAGNLRRLRQELGPRSPATLLPVGGGWSAVLRVPATLSEEERVLGLVERQGVLVHPGYFFDFPSEAHLVLSLLPEPDTFAAGVSRVLAGL
jgi:aspartate/methionine/tyrosine aminotransferase